MTEAYELHKLYGKHEFTLRGEIPNPVRADFPNQIFRCSCGLYVLVNEGIRRHISVGSAIELWKLEMRGALQRELVMIEAMEYLDFLEANRDTLDSDPAVCGNRAIEFNIDLAVKVVEQFIETSRGR